MRIVKPRCPCGGEYEVKNGGITCKVCEKPIHSEPLNTATVKDLKKVKRGCDEAVRRKR